MRLRARYTPEAAATIRKLHPDIKRRVRQALDSLVDSPYQGHPLRDELSGLRPSASGSTASFIELSGPLPRLKARGSAAD